MGFQNIHCDTTSLDTSSSLSPAPTPTHSVSWEYRIQLDPCLSLHTLLSFIWACRFFPWNSFQNSTLLFLSSPNIITAGPMLSALPLLQRLVLLFFQLRLPLFLELHKVSYKVFYWRLFWAQPGSGTRPSLMHVTTSKDFWKSIKLQASGSVRWQLSLWRKWSFHQPQKLSGDLQVTNLIPDGLASWLGHGTLYIVCSHTAICPYIKAL